MTNYNSKNLTFLAKKNIKRNRSRQRNLKTITTSEETRHFLRVLETKRRGQRGARENPKHAETSRQGREPGGARCCHPSEAWLLRRPAGSGRKSGSRGRSRADAGAADRLASPPASGLSHPATKLYLLPLNVYDLRQTKRGFRNAEIEAIVQWKNAKRRSARDHTETESAEPHRNGIADCVNFGKVPKLWRLHLFVLKWCY